MCSLVQQHLTLWQFCLIHWLNQPSTHSGVRWYAFTEEQVVWRLNWRLSVTLTRASRFISNTRSLLQLPFKYFYRAEEDGGRHIKSCLDSILIFSNVLVRQECLQTFWLHVSLKSLEVFTLSFEVFRLVVMVAIIWTTSSDFRWFSVFFKQLICTPATALHALRVLHHPLFLFLY